MEITMRQWMKSDSARMTELANNEKVARNLRDGFPYPYAHRDAVDYIKACLKIDRANTRVYAICVDGEPAGSIGVFRKSDVYRRSGEIGYWLGEPYWGKGIMTQCVETICREVFAETDIVRIMAEVFATNPASVRVLEKAGFLREGRQQKSVWKNGAFSDTIMMALVKE